MLGRENGLSDTFFAMCACMFVDVLTIYVVYPHVNHMETSPVTYKTNLGTCMCGTLYYHLEMILKLSTF